MSDDAFLEVLASCTDACAGMDLTDDAWKPPDGSFDVMVDDVASGLKEKEGINNAWIKPTFSILDGEFKGRTFTDYFWITPGMEEPSISIKNLCRFATCLQGFETKNPIEAAEVVKASIEACLTVEVYRTKSRKTGKTYANIRFCRLLSVDDVVDPSIVEPSDEE